MLPNPDHRDVTHGDNAADNGVAGPSLVTSMVKKGERIHLKGPEKKADPKSRISPSLAAMALFGVLSAAPFAVPRGA